MTKEKTEMENYFQFLGRNWKSIVSNNGSVNISEQEAQELVWQTFLLENSKDNRKPKPENKTNPKPKPIVKQVGSFVLTNPYLEQGGHPKVIGSAEGGNKPKEVVKNSSQVGEKISHVGEEISHVREKISHVGEEISYVGEKTSHEGEEISYVGEKTSHEGEEISHVRGEISRMGEKSAHVGQEGSHSGEESTHMVQKYVEGETANKGEEIGQIRNESIHLGEESPKVTDSNMADECTSDSEHIPVIVKEHISPVRRRSFRPKFIPPKSSCRATFKPNFRDTKQSRKPTSKFALKKFPFCLKLLENVSPTKQSVSKHEQSGKEQTSKPAVLVPIEQSITESEDPPATETISPTKPLPVSKTISDTEVPSNSSHVSNTSTVNDKEAQPILIIKPLPSEATKPATETLEFGWEDVTADTQTTTEEMQQDNIETKTKDAQQYKCEKCKKEYFQLKSFQSHVCLKNYVKIQCPSCAKMISKSNISHHMKTHSTPKYACEKCKKVFKEKTLLEKHVQKHVTAKKSICEQCGKIFQRPNHLKTHMKSHAEESDQSVISDVPGPTLEAEEKIFKCKVCDSEFSSTSKLKVHLKKSHLSEARKCVRCQKVFFSNRGLRSHMKTHSLDQPLDSEQFKVVMENVFIEDIVIENIGNMVEVASDGIFIIKDVNVLETDHSAINM